MTSGHHAPYVQGFTHATMAGTTGCDRATWSRSLKAGLSSDWSLQPGSMKSESLVIADQHCRGECVPGSCTHRPSSHESRQHPKCVAQPAYAGGSVLRWGRRLGLSRNKVAVPEGAAGSPPFYGDIFLATVWWPFLPRFPRWSRGFVRGVLVWKRSCGLEWCGHAFGFPDRHPWGLSPVWRPSSRSCGASPGGVRVVAGRVRGGLRTG